MQEEKKNNKQKVLVAIIIVLMLLIVAFIINFFVIKKKYYSDGEFRKVDGIDTYYEKDDLVKDSLVSYKGKKYFVDNEGHKKKNVWEIIDNDNHYGYFGSLGELVTNSLKEIDKKYYYFDKDGKLVTNDFVKYDNATYYASEDGSLLYRAFKILDKDYYFGRGGKLVVKEGWVRNRKDENKRGLPSGLYYLDEKGQRVKDKWLNDVYVDKNGKMAVDTWVGEYYVGKDGKYLHDTTTPDGVTLGSDGKPIAGQTIPTTTRAATQATQKNNNTTSTQQVVTSQTTNSYNTNAPTSVVVTQETTTAQEISSMTVNSALPSTEDLIKAGLQKEQESAQAAASITPGSGASVEQNGPTAVYQVVKGYAEGKNVEDDDDDTWYDDDDEDGEDDEVESEIKISSTQKISDTYDDDEYECTITLLQPVVKGGKNGEADTINDCMESMMDELSEEVDTIINGYEDLPKSIIFSSATITSSSSSRLVITLSGKVTPRSGTSKTVKYKITYDRNEEEATLTKV